MAERYLFGRELTPDTNISANYFATVVCPAVTKAMVVRRILAYPLVNGDYKSSLYKATAGDPADQITGLRVWYNNTAVSVVAGAWRELATDLALNFAIGDIPVLAACASATGVIARNSGAASGYTRKYKAATYSTYTAPAVPITTLTDVASAGQAMVAYGYVEPTITSVDEGFDLVDSSDLIELVGTDLLADGLESPILEICNNAVYASATIKVKQRMTVVGDTSVTFQYDRKGQIGAGTAYVFFTNNLGLRNAAGFAVPIGTCSLNYLQNRRQVVSGVYTIEGHCFGEGTPTVELCNNSTYASATVKTAQDAPIVVDDNTIKFTLDKTGFASTDLGYFFVTTAQGGRNISALTVQIAASMAKASTGKAFPMQWRRNRRRRV